MKIVSLSLLYLISLSPSLSAMIFTNDDRGGEVIFSVIFKGRKYTGRREIVVPSLQSEREFFQRRKRQEDLFQVNVKVGRRTTNCGVQKGHVDRYEAIYSRGRCTLRRI